MSKIKKVDSSPDSQGGQIYTNEFKPNPEPKPRMWIVDNFYENPDAIREFALGQYYFDDPGYLGMRTRKQYLFDGVKERFEQIIGSKIIGKEMWENYGMNGRFQSASSGTSLVYHCDQQMWAGMIYLTPNAPVASGTRLMQHKETKIRHSQEPVNGKNIDHAFNQHSFVDPHPYEDVDVAGNVYNRLVIFDAKCIHAAQDYFGWDIESGRLWHMFFFDTEPLPGQIK